MNPNLEVIGLGLGRTGTGSLKAALDQLGYKTFHMSEHPKDLDRYSKQWPEIYAKVDKGTIKRADWDDLYRDYTATMDFPTCMFPRELLAAYPKAKFILSIRNPLKWKKSTENTIYQMQTFPLSVLGPLLRERARKISKISSRIWKTFFRNDFPTTGIKTFEAHTELCKTVVPSDRLLVFNIEENDGWVELCTFLNKPIPEAPFPKNHEGKEMALSFKAYEKALVREALEYAAMGLVGLIGVGIGVWRWREKFMRT